MGEVIQMREGEARDGEVFASPNIDVGELVGVAQAKLDAPRLVTLDSPPPRCVGWALTPEEALDLAEALTRAANHCLEEGA